MDPPEPASFPPSAGRGVEDGDWFNLSETELEVLLEDGIVQHCSSTASVPGKRLRKVSAALLGPPQSTTGSLSSSSSGSSTASVRALEFSTSDALLHRSVSFDMPTTLVSTETLEWIGFTSATAAEICHRYQTRPDPRINPDSLLDYVEGHIVQLQLPAFRNMPPAQALERVGIQKSVQDALLDPDFTALLYTQDLHYWLRDTLTTNYATLIRLQDRLKNHAIRSVARKKQKRAADLRQPQSQITACASSSTPGTHELVPEVTANPTLNLTPEDHNLPRNQVQLLLPSDQEPDPIIPPGYTALYKGKAACDMPDGRSWIQEDGTFAMAALWTLPGGDFNFDSVAHYWTPEKETAEQYRSWAARRSPYSETWLIRILVSDSFVHSLKKATLWYSPDWKQYVWHCKKHRRLPPKFDSGTAGVDVIQGHICTGNTAPINTIPEHARITEEHVLQVPVGNKKNKKKQQKATQWAFVHWDAIKRLEEEIAAPGGGRIHIDITASTKVCHSWQQSL
ncbi:hypothetical protein ABEF95_008412 [Exophiala dermatitidis]